MMKDANTTFMMDSYPNHTDLLLGTIDASEEVVRTQEIDNEIVPLTESLREMMTACALEFAKTYKGYSVGGFTEERLDIARLVESYCPVCRRTHSKQSGFMFATKTAIMYTCWQRKEHDGKAIVLQQLDKKVDKYKLTPEEILVGNLKKINKVKKSSTWFGCDKTDLEGGYISPEKFAFLLDEHDSVMVRAPMGAGKTHAIIDYIKSRDVQSMLGVSFRKSFTEEKVSDYNATSYLSFENVKQIPNTVKFLYIQYESLHKINPAKYPPPDLLVLDEIESIIEQMRGCHDMSCFSVFHWLVNHSKKVVVCDAALSSRTINLFKLITKRVFFCHEFYTPVFKDASFTLYPNYASLLQHACEAAEHEKIGIVSDSKRSLKVMKKYLHAYLPSKKILLVEKDTKDEFLRMVKEKQGVVDGQPANIREAESAVIQDYDIFLYSPSIQSGCSFEGTGIRKLYCYFTGVIAEVPAMQMMGRIRGADQFHMAINFTKHAYPEEIDEIRRLQWSDKEWSKIAKNVPVRWDVDGKMVILETEESARWLLLRSYEHISTNHFAKLLAGWLRYYGARFVGCDFFISNRTLVEYGKEVSLEDAALIASARDITVDEAYGIERRKLRMTQEERLALAKYKIVSTYRMEPSYCKTEFVIKYGNQTMQTIFTNLNASRAHSPEEFLRTLKDHLSHYDGYHKPESNYQDKKNTLSQICGMELLNLLGYPTDRLDNEYTIGRQDLIEKMKTSVADYFKKNNLRIRAISGSRDLLREFANLSLARQRALVDDMLHSSYGLSLKCLKRGEGGTYNIKQSSEFIFLENENRFIVDVSQEKKTDLGPWKDIPPSQIPKVTLVINPVIKFMIKSLLGETGFTIADDTQKIFTGILREKYMEHTNDHIGTKTFSSQLAKLIEIKAVRNGKVHKRGCELSKQKLRSALTHYLGTEAEDQILVAITSK